MEMDCNKELRESPKQKIGNVNKMTNYSFRCINCGNNRDINLIAHRNKNKYVTGFIAVCEECCKLLNGSDKNIRMMID